MPCTPSSHRVERESEGARNAREGTEGRLRFGNSAPAGTRKKRGYPNSQCLTVDYEDRRPETKQQCNWDLVPGVPEATKSAHCEE
ncbi:hypothetical protein CBR_g30749 [Chara braunii]|uniref:Uncharacterized protein n=1 Tax=Chara braunii TaxID=69332 RepID=A0A388LDK2_CHABU|nr:hypothetical protein CBR_g30749 [Chara braunii]|eukprot:GBG80381.1 hypothetical protein CBR_g30749 [Chara braunii]